MIHPCWRCTTVGTAAHCLILWRKDRWAAVPGLWLPRHPCPSGDFQPHCEGPYSQRRRPGSDPLPTVQRSPGDAHHGVFFVAIRRFCGDPLECLHLLRIVKRAKGYECFHKTIATLIDAESQPNHMYSSDTNSRLVVSVFHRLPDLDNTLK